MMDIDWQPMTAPMGEGPYFMLNVIGCAPMVGERVDGVWREFLDNQHLREVEPIAWAECTPDLLAEYSVC